MEALARGGQNTNVDNGRALMVDTGNLQAYSAAWPKMERFPADPGLGWAVSKTRLVPYPLLRRGWGICPCLCVK